MAKVQARLPELWDDSQVLRRPLIELGAPGTLFTVGHSTHPIEEFIALLRSHEIEEIDDVRRFPGSKRHPQFNPEALGRSLAEAGIAYMPMPELGGRRKPVPDSPHVAWRNEAFRGYADFMDTPEFAEAALQLAERARARRVAVMCSEGVWWRCHRSMIADYFKAGGWTVLHIMSTGARKEHPYTPVAKAVGGYARLLSARRQRAVFRKSRRRRCHRVRRSRRRSDAFLHAGSLSSDLQARCGRAILFPACRRCRTSACP